MNTGEINNPDFDFADYSGGFHGPSMDPMSFVGSLSSVTVPQPDPPQDLADVSFTPTFYPSQLYDYDHQGHQ